MMAFSSGPYALFASLPAPPRPEIHSSRRVNFSTGRYELDSSTGGNLGMRSTAQRVVILAAKAHKRPQFNTDRERNRIRADILAGLSILTQYGSEVIDQVQVTVQGDAPGIQFTEVVFRDLTSGLTQSVQLT